MDVPADLKFIAPYIQRGEELKEREPIVSYYATYYAVKLALQQGPNTPDTKLYISHLLDGLEQTKKGLGDNNEAITSDLVGYAHLENFALKVFVNADNEDRAGKASKKTAKTFLASSVFLELLKTFGPIEPEVESKIKYAKWKAADIMKALREGRTPVPGPPGGIDAAEEDVAMGEPGVGRAQEEAQGPPGGGQDDASFLQPPASVSPPSFPAPQSISDFPSPPSNFTAPISPNDPSQIFDNPASADDSAPHPPAAPTTTTTTTTTPPSTITTPPPPMPATAPVPPPAPAPAPAATPSPSHSFGIPSSAAAPAPAPAQPQTHVPTPALPPVASVGPMEIAAAQKNAKWAISALNYDDIATARTQLITALNQLGFHRGNNYGYTD
ncbi:Vta1 like-domain-containing protein [Gongronella butleri]|nr:Vta1 like-domain-containing protein [Gongronella butleri]